MGFIKRIFAGIAAFFIGFFKFVKDHPAVTLIPAVKMATAAFCKKYPKKADNIAATFAYLAKIADKSQMTEEEFEKLMNKHLSDITDDPIYQDALKGFMDSFRELMSEYLATMPSAEKKRKVLAQLMNAASETALAVAKQYHEAEKKTPKEE